MRVVWLVASFLVATASGCTNEGPGVPAAGPGAKAWNSADVRCASTADCNEGEVCDQGICQMHRCGETYQSAPPMGQMHFLSLDQEVALVGDDLYVDGYKSDGNYLSSWTLGGKVLDVAGGTFLPTRPQGVATAYAYSDKIVFQGVPGVTEISTGIWPQAIAAGDVDGDGLDELVAVAADGSVAICDVDTQQCNVAFPGGAAQDVTVTDIDGDGYEDIVMLVGNGGGSSLIAFNPTTMPEAKGLFTFSKSIRAIAGADLDGDGVGEIVALETSSFGNDTLDIIEPASGQKLGAVSVSGDSLDVAAGDTDGDGKGEIALLRSSTEFEVFHSNAPGTLASLGVKAASISSQSSRITMLDWDGDSPAGRLTDGPNLVAGSVVPIAVLLFPPYSRTHSSGDASVSLGNTETESMTVSDTVTLRLHLAVGLQIYAGLFWGSAMAYFEKEHEQTREVMNGIEIGREFSVKANPAKYGTDYATVVLSCGCFHSYVYETDDPANRIGGSGQQMTVFVPVGGQTGLWSTKRYNAIAEALGGMPIIDVPFHVGDVGSYPTAGTTLSGAPIAPEDQVFQAPPTYQVSDTGDVSWSLAVQKSETNTMAESTTIGMEAALGFVVAAEAEADQQFTQAYSITVGSEATFGGIVPPIEDDPKTPEDEYAVYRYSFAPMVYREHYQDLAGRDAGYYVISYAAGK